MSADSKIEWTDHTFNPWIGCTKVAPACDNCYAERSSPARVLHVRWGAGQPRHQTSLSNWTAPLRWNAQPFYECPDCGLRGDARAMGDHPKACNHENARPTRQRVFCASLADVFDNEVPEQWRADLLQLIADTPNLDWLLLTKRIGNAEGMLDAALDVLAGGGQRWRDIAWPNVWIGATITSQDEAERDIPKLLALRAHVHFISMEPLLSRVHIRDHWLIHHHPDDAAIDWVIVGGESGADPRPMSPDWARALRDQCAGAGVPFLFKQWGEWLPMLGQVNGVAVRAKTVTADGWVMGLAGKKAAGRALDGVLHDGYPA